MLLVADDADHPNVHWNIFSTLGLQWPRSLVSRSVWKSQMSDERERSVATLMLHVSILAAVIAACVQTLSQTLTSRPTVTRRISCLWFLHSRWHGLLTRCGSGGVCSMAGLVRARRSHSENFDNVSHASDLLPLDFTRPSVSRARGCGVHGKASSISRCLPSSTLATTCGQ